MALNTFTDMAQRIANELNVIEYTNEISIAIANAIFHYQGERFWFNEDRSKTFSLSSSQEYYTSTDFSNMEQILDIDSIQINTSSTDRTQLTRRTWDWFEQYSTTTSNVGRPTDYCYYQQRLRFYPIPNGGYTVRVSGVYKLQADASLTASTSTAWFSEAEELIRSRVEADIYETLLYDQKKAEVMRRREDQALSRLRRETSRRIGTGTITPTDF
jgi:hypothetical protein